MKKLMAGGVAALGIATGSLAIAAINPLGLASAQTDSTATASGATGSGTSATAQKPGDGLKSVLDGLVQSGTITQAQADAITQKMDEWRAANPRPDHGGKGGAMAGAKLDEIATALGTTVEDLQAKLQAGQTLRAIAGDKVDALTTLLTTNANARIDAQLADGKITAETAATMKAQVAAKVQEMLDRTGPVGGGRGPGGHRGGAPAGAPTAQAPATTTN